MYSSYNFNNKSTSSNILSILTGSMLLLIVGTIFFNIVIYLIPTAVLGYGVFFLIKRVKGYIARQKSYNVNHFSYSEASTVMSSVDIIEKAIRENKVIETEYTEL